MAGINGNVEFSKGANQTPESSAEMTQETYNQLKDIESSIRANIYTDTKANEKNTTAQEKYRLKASSINFL